MDSSGLDVTKLYLKGAYRTLDIARQIQATCVVLKKIVRLVVVKNL